MKKIIIVTCIITGICIGIFFVSNQQKHPNTTELPSITTNSQDSSNVKKTYPATQNSITFNLHVSATQSSLSLDPLLNLIRKVYAQEDSSPSWQKQWQAGGADMQADVYYSQGMANGSGVELSVQKKDEDNYSLSIYRSSKDTFKPGKYTLKITINQDGKTREITQDFSWGVLAINPNKSVYVTGDTATIAMGVLDDFGETICDANLTLTVDAPDKNTTSIATENNTIEKSKVCSRRSAGDGWDYKTELKLSQTGIYNLHLKAVTANGEKEITDEFEVKDNVPFEIDRVSFPTRIYPPHQYPVTLKISANQDFAGRVVETLPAAFKIFASGPDSPIFKTDTSGDQKILTWNVDFKKGETYALDYTIVFPNISPEFYLIGPLGFYAGTELDKSIFSEARAWEVASDAISTMTTTDNTFKLGFPFEKKGVVSSDGSVAFIINTFTISPTGNEIYMTTNPDATTPSFSVLAHNTNFSIVYPNSITINPSTNDTYSAVASDEVNQRLSFKKETYDTSTKIWTDGAEVLVGTNGTTVTIAYPDIERDSTGHLWTVWKQSKSNAPNKGNFVEVSDAAEPGTTWASATALSSTGTYTASTDVMYPSLHRFNCGGNKLAVIYAHTNGTISWRWRNDSDATGTWAGAETSILTATPSNGGKDFSTISDDSGNLHLVYQAGSGIKYRKGTCSAGSITWDAADTTLSSSASDINPDFTTDGTNLWVVAAIFSASNQYNIAYKKYTAQSTSWDSSWANITSDNPVLDNEMPGVASRISANGRMYLTWNQGTGTPYNVQFASVLVVPYVQINGGTTIRGGTTLQ